MENTAKRRCGAFKYSANYYEELHNVREITLQNHVSLLKDMNDRKFVYDFFRVREAVVAHYRCVNNIIRKYNRLLDRAVIRTPRPAAHVALAEATRLAIRGYWLSLRKLHGQILDVWGSSPYIIQIPDFDDSIDLGSETAGQSFNWIRDFWGKILRF